MTTSQTEREAFERFVELETGRDMAYHLRGRTTGLEFAWRAWQTAGKRSSIAVGRIELRQAEPGSPVTITHVGKTGARVSIVLPAATLEAWAIRQMRAEVFSG